MSRRRAAALMLMLLTLPVASSHAQEKPGCAAFRATVAAAVQEFGRVGPQLERLERVQGPQAASERTRLAKAGLSHAERANAALRNLQNQNCLDFAGRPGNWTVMLKESQTLVGRFRAAAGVEQQPARPAQPAAPQLAAAKPSASAQWQGPQRAAIKAFVEKQNGATNLPWPVAFYGDFNGDSQEDALVFVYSDIPGAAGNFDLKVALFRGEGGQYRFMRYANDVFGSEPREPKFTNGVVEITTTMPKPGDPRCCPTGSRRYTIRTL
jgi:hypothetical protein